MKTLMALVTAGMVVAAAVGADKPLSWPQFRGPGGAGVAQGQKPPVEFGPEKNVRWKVAVPSGLSSPIVAGANLVLTAFDNDRLYSIAYQCRHRNLFAICSGNHDPSTVKTAIATSAI